ncbi:MAG TPA: GNAT family N-acetyltransferase [Polyangiaceae bacterium]|nr:GNAT family N-acetyltransferase [Polyangiaceae bacterium]
MIEIRPYRPEDRAGLIALVSPIQREEFGVPITPEEQPDLVAVEDFFGRGASRFWVALDGATVVGAIGLLDAGEGLGVVRKMFVAAPYRGRGSGLAQRLFDALLERARERGLRALYLGSTARMQAAHRFYEKNGFEPVAPEALPATFPRVHVDTHFFRRVLTPAAG